MKNDVQSAKVVLNNPSKFILLDKLKNEVIIELPIVKKTIRYYKNKNVVIGYYHLMAETMIPIEEGSIVMFKLIGLDDKYIMEGKEEKYEYGGTFTFTKDHLIRIDVKS